MAELTVPMLRCKSEFSVNFYPFRIPLCAYIQEILWGVLLFLYYFVFNNNTNTLALAGTVLQSTAPF